MLILEKEYVKLAAFPAFPLTCVGVRGQNQFEIFQACSSLNRLADVKITVVEVERRRADSDF